MKNIHTVKVMWPDCDPAGIIFYGNYFRWMDDATHHLMDKAGFSFERLLGDLGIPGFPLVATHADFRSPAKLGDTLDIESHVSAIGRTSFTVSHTITRETDLIVDSWQKRVWCHADPDDARKITTIPVSEEFKQALAST